MSLISQIKARTILDSRGEWTVEAELFASDGKSYIASVPQGKSVGSHEAVNIDPHQACEKIESIISPALFGMDCQQQDAIDKKLRELDGTENKNKLGANAILACSLAAARAGAGNLPLWKYLQQISQTPHAEQPLLFCNLINGGLHSGNGLNFQEYLVIPNTRDIQQAVEMAKNIYHELGVDLKEKMGESSTGLGDEGGFAPRFSDDFEPFEMIQRAAGNLKLADDILLGLDAAGSNVKLTNLEQIYTDFIAKFTLHYLEDPFGEEEFEKFASLKLKYPQVLVTGDDLTTTNPGRLGKAIEANSISGIIIKLNQIGTVSETIQVINQAKAAGIKIIVSHRSGETNDDFIADLAVGVAAYGMKLGAPARGERVAKYDRLLEIEKEMR